MGAAGSGRLCPSQGGWSLTEHQQCPPRGGVGASGGVTWRPSPCPIRRLGRRHVSREVTDGILGGASAGVACSGPSDSQTARVVSGLVPEASPWLLCSCQCPHPVLLTEQSIRC